MIQQFKMYCKFVLWLLKKAVSLGGFIPEYFSTWKDSVRTEFMLSVFLWVVPTLGSIMGAVATFFATSEDGARPGLSVFLNPVYFTAVIYFCVIVSALYDVFLEDYEQTFTILKETNER